MPDIEFKSGADWRKPREEGVPIKLPNGTWIKLRPISFDLFLKLARIPDHMTAIVERMMRESGLSKAQNVESITNGTDTIDLFKQDRMIKEEFARVALVYPRVVDNPVADDEISVDDLRYEELEFIMAFFGSPIIELESFSLKQKASVADMDSQSVDNDETQRTDANIEMDQPEASIS